MITGAGILTGSDPIVISTAPVFGKVNRYDASSGPLTPNLPALVSANVGARLIIEKADATDNMVLFTCTGEDTFIDGSTIALLEMPGEQAELQVLIVDGIKYYYGLSSHFSIADLDTRYLDGIHDVKLKGAKGNAVVTTGAIASGQHTLTKTSGNFVSADVGKAVVIPAAGVTRSVSDGNITSGSPTLTSATATFTSADVRSTVTIAGAGVAGTTLTAKVKKYRNGTTVDLDTNASTTVTNHTTTVTVFLNTTISSVSGGVATLAAAAGATVAGATFIYGTDDSIACNAAMAAAAGGGQVYFPSGKYLISASISLDQANYVNIMGAGEGATSIYQIGSGGSAAFHTLTFSSGSPLTQFSMSNMTIDGAYMQGAYNVHNCGVRAQYLQRCTFDHMTIRNTLATGLGIDWLTHGTVIDNIRALNCGAGSYQGSAGGGCAGIGIAVGMHAIEEFVVSNCHAAGNGTFGIFIEASAGSVMATGMRITGSSAEGNGLSGFGDCGGIGAIWTGNWSYNNIYDGFTNCAGTTTYAIPGQDTLWSDNVAYFNGRHGFSYTPLVLGFNTFQPNTTAQRISWKNCKAWSNGLRGFEVDTGSGGATIDKVTLDNCEGYQNNSSGLLFNGTGLVKNVQVNNCSVPNNGLGLSDTFGVRFNCNVTDARIRGLTAYDNNGTQKQTYGVTISSGITVTNLFIDAASDLRGNKLGAFLNSGTVSGLLTLDAVGIHSGVTPTIAAGTGAGTSPAVSVTGDDRSGKVNITIGSAPAPGILATITFANAFTVAPNIVLSPGDAQSAAADLYWTSSTTGFSVRCASTPEAADGLTISYLVRGA